MQIFVRSNATFILRVDEETNLAEVRDLISEHEDIPTAELRLYSEGSPLDDESFPVTSLNTPVIDVIVALKGGKVHGSLSRAGKVKGQTPKVEKTEKPKKKTGRAKRRKQYNQRFDKNGQVIKRKPNSNANKTS